MPAHVSQTPGAGCRGRSKKRGTHFLCNIVLRLVDRGDSAAEQLSNEQFWSFGSSTGSASGSASCRNAAANAAAYAAASTDLPQARALGEYIQKPYGGGAQSPVPMPLSCPGVCEHV